MKFDIYTQKGTKAERKAELNDSVFAAPINDKLLAQYVYIYLSNQRASVAHTKDRSEVSGGGRKPWRQKGTGNARAGSNRSPIWVHGGITFGPSSERNWKRDLNKKMRVAAMRSALSKVVATKKLQIVDKVDLASEKLAQQAVKMLGDFKVTGKSIVVTEAKNESIMKAFRNIPNVRVVQVGELNAYDLLTGGNVLMLEAAIAYTDKWTK